MSEFWVHGIKGSSSFHIQRATMEDAIAAARELAPLPDVNNVRVRGVEGEIPWREDHVEMIPPAEVPPTFRSPNRVEPQGHMYIAPKGTPPGQMIAGIPDPEVWTLF